MAKYFTQAELTASDIARARGIDNTPPPSVLPKLAALANKLLNPVREMWGAPIRVNSGYRSPDVNKAVDGAAGSQHIKGEAADITTGTVTGNKILFDKMVAAQKRGEIAFDQLIDEKGYRWLHVSYRASGNRNQILHLK
jgi:uncharacterized protein YcbK (DUF882 family)